MNNELKSLTEYDISILYLSPETWDSFENSRHMGTRFSLTFPHKQARAGKARSPVLVVVGGEKPILKIGLVRSIQAVATRESRVSFDFVRSIEPDNLDILLRQITESRLQAGVAKLSNNSGIFYGENFHIISPKLGKRLVELIASIPSNIPVLRQILSSLNRPKWFNNARAMQQDAVNLALKAFDIGDGSAVEVTLPGADTALGTIRLQEDAAIEHDARWIPGWRLAKSDLTGRALFVKEGERLEVFTANKRPLEELFGVDLIYLNEARGALIMVQYKMMEPQESQRRQIRTVVPEMGLLEYHPQEKEWIVPINDQFKEELGRMNRFDRDLSPSGPYRLNCSPFFFKLIKRNSSANASGIMLSLGHLQQMITEGSASGPRGGLRISYTSLDGHYLRSDPFIDLVRSGYIGTRGATTEHLQKLIDAALNGGRAVVAAIQSQKRDPDELEE